MGAMFYRYISENFAAYINAGEIEAGNTSFDYAKIPDAEAEEARAGLIEEKGFFICPSELFCNVRAKASSDENLNETLERVFSHIEDSAKGSEAEDNFAGLFDDFDVNSNKLGSTVAKRNERLVKILNGVADMNLAYKDSAIDAFGDAYEYLMTMYASDAGKSGGEFFTPSDVSELLTRHGTVGKTEINKVYDPVSSMDSSALFIVSSLVREMIGVCSNNVVLEKREYEGNYIKQLFVLTHNAFFHREITYNMVRHYRYVFFYKINKKNNISTVELCVDEAKKVSDKDKNYNPMQNSYSALWTEYSTLTSIIPLMNVIRRILEYYFLQLCGYEGYDLTKKVLEEKKDSFITPIEGAAPDMTRFHLAKSMLAYMHSTDTFNDGLNFVDESMDCDQYRDVFKTIFEVLDQSQHYNRMMNEFE